MPNDNRSLSHTKWNCKYHIVFAPKYRRKVFFQEKREAMGKILRQLCEWKGIEIHEAEICADHVHMLVSIPPKVSVSNFMGYLKGKSSLMIYEQFGNLKFKYKGREFWCRGYYVDTVGKNKEKIAESTQNSHSLPEEAFQKTGLHELELTLMNEALGSQHPTGRWWTYDTPQNGVRRASAHSIVFQAVQGSPELNCCSVNGPRMLGMTGEWGVYTDEDTITVNYYGKSRWESYLASGTKVILTQHTAYPAEPLIVIDVAVSNKSAFAVKLRIPAWSQNTKVSVGGECFTATHGEYLSIEREWQGGEKIEIEMDFSLHTWRGRGEVEGLNSLYRSPVLLTIDQRFNAINFTDIPAVNPNALEMIESNEKWFTSMFMLRDKTNSVILCDFATAGATGTRYASWFRLTDSVRLSCYQPD